MAAESIITTITDGTTDLTFYRLSMTGYSSRWGWSGNTTSLRLFLDFQHDVSPLGTLKSDVHNMTLRREEINSTTGKLAVSTISLQAKVPKDSVISSADVENDISAVMALMNKTFTNGFLSGIVLSGDYNVTGPFNPARA